MRLGVPDEQQPHLEVSPHGTARTKDIMDRKRKHSEGRGAPSEELPPVAKSKNKLTHRDLVDTDDRLGFDRRSYPTVASKPKAEPPVCQFTPPKLSRRGTAMMINNTRNSTIGQPLQETTGVVHGQYQSRSQYCLHCQATKRLRVITESSATTIS
jgi:hypothetical protein